MARSHTPGRERRWVHITMSHNHCPTITLSNSLTLSHYHTRAHCLTITLSHDTSSHTITLLLSLPNYNTITQISVLQHPDLPTHTRICSKTRAFLCKLKFTCLLQLAWAGLNLWVGPTDLACIITTTWVLLRDPTSLHTYVLYDHSWSDSEADS